MLARALAALGVICIILGVLKFLGIIAIGSAGAGVLIVVGVILLIVAEYVIPSGFTGTRSRGRL